jgi:geranylgeranylglycerol-phosphate geranylgeranyltransferase
MNKIQGFIQLIRPINCVMMGLATIIGVLLSGKNIFYCNEFLFVPLLGFLTAFTFTGASMSINDYYDREIDVVNEPDRPIPSGLIKPSEALALALILIGIGLTSALFTNLICFVISLIVLLIFVTYSTIGKRTGLFGNFLVSACVSIPFIYGSFTIGSDLKLNAIIFSALAFLSNTGREITKGIVDIKGDRSQNIKTIAVIYGADSAAYTATGFYISAVVLSILPLTWSLVSFLYIPLIIITDLGFITTSISLIRNYSRENARKNKKLVLIWMLMGLIAFTVGVII